MPRYDFACHECNHQFEHLTLKAPVEPLELTCPSCESGNIRKLLSAPNIQFKGSGFYKTDSKKDAPTPPSKKE